MTQLFTWGSRGSTYYINGPGMPGYYGSELQGHLNCKSIEDAKRTIELCDTAYRQGYEQAQRDIRKALGIDNT